MVKIDYDDIIAYVERCGTKGICRIRHLCDRLDGIIRDYRNRHYIHVEIFSTEGRIDGDIKKRFPDFIVWWIGGENTIGTNHVLVPTELWNDEVKEELSKFDSFVGHHCMKHREMRIRKDAKLAEPYASNRCSWSDREIYRREHAQHPDWFEDVEVVDNEWDEKLIVYDFREITSKYDASGMSFTLDD